MSALDDLVNKFKANQNSMPQVNPPAAAKVLEEQTKPEVAGQKPAAAVAQPAPQTSTASVAANAPATASTATAAEPEGKPRRTAAVVQAELDQVAAELKQATAALDDERRRHSITAEAVTSLRAQVAAANAEKEKALSFAEQVVADNAKLSSSDAPRAGDLTVESAAVFLKTKGFGIFTLGAQ